MLLRYYQRGEQVESHPDKPNLYGRFRRAMNVAMDPTVSGVTWSRAFTQNPPLKDPCTRPSLSCPPPLPTL